MHKPFDFNLMVAPLGVVTKVGKQVKEKNPDHSYLQYPAARLWLAEKPDETFNDLIT